MQDNIITPREQGVLTINKANWNNYEHTRDDNQTIRKTAYNIHTGCTANNTIVRKDNNKTPARRLNKPE